MPKHTEQYVQRRSFRLFKDTLAQQSAISRGVVRDRVIDGTATERIA
ncbi:hypothetical protein [Micromonospora sp. CA-111912]